MRSIFITLSPLYAIVIYSIAFFTAFLLKSNYKIQYSKGRYDTIDGLRGFLAIGVFIHHTSVWYDFLEDGIWGLPPSNFYSQLGQTSVSLFFMITSFLFVSKLLNAKDGKFDWKYFFVSRLLRLVPMYYVSVAIMIFIIMYITQWQLQQIQVSDFIVSLFHWGLFTIYKTPNINNAGYTSVVNAGVVWSLQYEWLFYFFLPLLGAIILKHKPKFIYLIIAVVFIVSFYQFRKINYYFIYAFMGGGLAPVLLKYTNWKSKMNHIYSSAIVLSCLFLLLLYNNISNVYCTLLITIVFTLIAMGCSVFGVLKNATLKFLGEICYSTYLLHGILLYTVFDFGFGFNTLRKYSLLEYYLVTFSITPALVVLSYFGFKYIEKPFIGMAKFLGKEKI